MKIATLRFASKAALAFFVVVVLGMLAACGGSGGSRSSNTGGGGTPPVITTEFLYAGNAAGGVSAFSVDQNAGTLTPVTGTPFAVGSGAAPGAVRLAADPSGTVIYATNASTGGPNLLAMSVNASTGALTAAANQALTIAPGKLAVDPAGKNLYVIPDPSANAPEVIGFSIAPATHVLAALPNQPTGVAGVPHDITVDPSGAFVYITLAGTPGDEIGGRSRDRNTGLLSVLAGSPFGNIGGDNPQGIRITPSGTFAVIANFATNNVSVMSLTPATGMLTNVGGSPFAAGTGPIAVAIDPSGKFVFVVNQGSNNLSVYTIGPQGGLAPVAGSPFTVGASPQAVAVDPSGKFVYVSAGDGSISAFMLNASTGALTPITGSPFSAGVALRDVVVVKP